jgi:F0F1-type ATP synthase alpha subunit
MAPPPSKPRVKLDLSQVTVGTCAQIQNADRVGADLDVAIAGFADTYMLHQNWTKLSSDTADSVGQQLDPQASRNTGVDTEILPTT